MAINSLQRQVNTLRAVDYGPIQYQVQEWTEKFCSADLDGSGSIDRNSSSRIAVPSEQREALEAYYKKDAGKTLPSDAL